jgi:hypothetical protein
MVTSGAAQNREEAMMLRIIHGKLKPGTWDSYERAYKDIMAAAAADSAQGRQEKGLTAGLDASVHDYALPGGHVINGD